MDNNTKHTPGPWRIETVRSSGYGQRRIVSDNIARDWQSRDDVHDPRGESVASGIYVEADARLIAAAPELLATLQAIADVADENTGRCFCDYPAEGESGIIECTPCTFKGIRDAARAAIARAKGESK